MRTTFLCKVITRRGTKALCNFLDTLYIIYGPYVSFSIYTLERFNSSVLIKYPSNFFNEFSSINVAFYLYSIVTDVIHWNVKIETINYLPPIKCKKSVIICFNESIVDCFYKVLNQKIKCTYISNCHLKTIDKCICDIILFLNHQHYNSEFFGYLYVSKHTS